MFRTHKERVCHWQTRLLENGARIWLIRFRYQMADPATFRFIFILQLNHRGLNTCKHLGCPGYSSESFKGTPFLRGYIFLSLPATLAKVSSMAALASFKMVSFLA